MRGTFKFVIIALLVVLVGWRFGGFRAATHASWSGSGNSWSWSSDEGSDSGPTITRDYSWSADRLELDIPARARFHPASSWHLSIRGRKGALDRIEVSDGEIREKDHGFSFFGWHPARQLQVDLSGPTLQAATLNGSGSIDLEDLSQDRLRLRIRGSGTASGNGKVQSLQLEIMGSGSAHLAQLAATNADVTIDGSGVADVSPTGEARVTIAGSGDVRLHAHPAQLSTHVYGSGQISESPVSAPAAGNPAPGDRASARSGTEPGTVWSADL